MIIICGIYASQKLTSPPRFAFTGIMALTLACTVIGCSIPANALNKKVEKGRHLNERDYRDAWCQINHGIKEYRLDDGTRVDCLTATHAIEFDFAKKWAESIGQALYYGKKTGKTPMVVLILSGQKDSRFVSRAKLAAPDLDILVMYPNFLSK